MICVYTHTQRNIIQLTEKEKSALWNSMHKLGEHYAKFNKPDRARQILYELTDNVNLKKSNSQNQQVEWWSRGVAGGGENGEMLVKGYKLSAIR